MSTTRQGKFPSPGSMSYGCCWCGIVDLLIHSCKRAADTIDSLSVETVTTVRSPLTCCAAYSPHQPCRRSKRAADTIDSLSVESVTTVRSPLTCITPWLLCSLLINRVDDPSERLTQLTRYLSRLRQQSAHHSRASRHGCNVSAWNRNNESKQVININSRLSTTTPHPYNALVGGSAVVRSRRVWGGPRPVLPPLPQQETAFYPSITIASPSQLLMETVELGSTAERWIETLVILSPEAVAKNIVDVKLATRNTLKDGNVEVADDNVGAVLYN
ncbi:hypothetical protein J6590_023513 [Homalodisca vitripennis]|nr:hypothetical protein J6590_023513 [Homalodisca vitripennis]